MLASFYMNYPLFDQSFDVIIVFILLYITFSEHYSQMCAVREHLINRIYIPILIEQPSDAIFEIYKQSY